ncbi:conjugal transfer nickase/helicase domain-containing protein [Gilvimarinus polysaccharolyticus]|uniref:conjugal transfer nickase/helicase domain-containing protein n=1 Tax=Gilvimarinus polysaccharolyticus TaxID=863921 RepID=UPI0006739032|nr:DNA-binding domain-containing protein [Gilvimarinus polysaccharolyticus]
MGQTNNCAFITWLQKSIDNGAIKIGADDSPVHVVRGGLFIVSPTTFKLFCAGKWLDAQHEFLSLQLHARSPVDQGNFHSQRIRGRPSGLLAVNLCKVGILVPFQNVERLLPRFSTHLFDREVAQWG